MSVLLAVDSVPHDKKSFFRSDIQVYFLTTIIMTPSKIIKNSSIYNNQSYL